MIRSPEYNQTFRLDDGRNLGYAVSGHPQGKQVFYLGGFPGSRLDALAISDTALEVGVKIISVDRPGFGLSDPLPGRSFMSLAGDIKQLSQALQIHTFGMLGVSGGGPYAAACALAMPNRIASVSLVSSIGPLCTSKLLFGMTPFYRRLIKFSAFTSLGLRWAIARHMQLTREDSIGFYLDLLKVAPPCDQVAILNSRMHMLALATSNEAYRRGIEPVLYEARLYLQDWGLCLRDIKPAVTLWHGAKDEMVPIAMGAYLSEQIPKAEVHFYENDGHCLLLNRSKQILERISELF